MRVNHTFLPLILFIIFLWRFHMALTEDVESATDNNEIIPREAIEKLDFSVRQALLRAIDKLEQEAAEEEEKNKSDIETSTINSHVAETTTSNSSPIITKDEILEESITPDEVIPTVQFFTATFDEKNTHEQPLSSFIDRSKSWKKTGKTLRESSLSGPVVVSESVGTISPATSDKIRQTARSVTGSSVHSNEISNERSDEIKFEIRSSKNGLTPTTTTTRKPNTTKRLPRPTTTTTTTTTTPRPTHNEDGENIEVVDKDDIKIQKAPLVTAFTVDLDERGSTKKVVPIIHPDQSVIGPTITKLNVLPAGPQSSSFIPTVLPVQSTQLTTSPNLPLMTGNSVTERTSQLNTENFDRNTSPTNANNFLIERQRQLEQQIYQLKLQAQQQQELILRQLKILEEQSHLRNDGSALLSPPQQQIPLPTVASLLPQQQIQNQQQSTIGFTIRPSIEFIPSTHTKPVSVFSPFPADQQLPLNDSPNKFITHTFNSNFNQNNNNNLSPNSLSSLQTQQLPLNNPVRQIFHNLQNLQNPQVTAAPANLAPTTVQVQPSNQLSFGPTFSPALQNAKAPLELSVFQPLPQHSFQQFQQQAPLVPSYVSNAILQQQRQQHHQQSPQLLQQQLQPQQQLQQHQHPQHHRFFRQESGTANFGINQVEIQPSNSFTSNLPSSTINQQTIDNQNFYRQHLDPQLSNQLQQKAQQYYQQLQLQHQHQHQQHQQKTTAGNLSNSRAYSSSSTRSNNLSNNRNNNINLNTIGSENSNSFQKSLDRNRFVLNNLEEFNIIRQVLALNHGINGFGAQNPRFNGGGF